MLRGKNPKSKSSVVDDADTTSTLLHRKTLVYFVINNKSRMGLRIILSKFFLLRRAAPPLPSKLKGNANQQDNESVTTCSSTASSRVQSEKERLAGTFLWRCYATIIRTGSKMIVQRPRKVKTTSKMVRTA